MPPIPHPLLALIALILALLWLIDDTVPGALRDRLPWLAVLVGAAIVVLLTR